MSNVIKRHFSSKLYKIVLLWKVVLKWRQSLCTNGQVLWPLCSGQEQCCRLYTLTYSYMRSLHSIRPCQFNRINWLNLFSGAGNATTRSRQCDHIFMEKSVAYCIMAIFMVATLIFVCRVVIVALSLSRSKNCCVPSSANLRCLLIQFYFNFSSPSPTVWNNLPEIYIHLNLSSAPPVPMCGPTYQKYIQLYLTLAPPAPMCGTT